MLMMIMMIYCIQLLEVVDDGRTLKKLGLYPWLLSGSELPDLLRWKSWSDSEESAGDKTGQGTTTRVSWGGGADSQELWGRHVRER